LCGKEYFKKKNNAYRDDSGFGQFIEKFSDKKTGVDLPTETP